MKLRIACKSRLTAKEYLSIATRQGLQISDKNKLSFTIDISKETIIDMARSSLKDDILSFMCRHYHGFEQFDSVAYLPYSEISEVL